MPLSPLCHLGTMEEKDHHNKVGVLTTLAQGQPHTTVLAFLSSLQDDVFLISMPGTFKSQVLKREPRCFFTIDERAKFTFEQSIEWNYTNMEMRAPPRAHSIAGVRADSHRVHPEKPWEAAFFMSSELEMFHLERSAVVCAGELRLPQ